MADGELEDLQQLPSRQHSGSDSKRDGGPLVLVSPTTGGRQGQSGHQEASPEAGQAPSRPERARRPPCGRGDARQAPPAEEIELVNKTARRICIRRDGSDLVVAPFDVVRTTETAAQGLDLSVWLERGYVEKRAPVHAEEPSLDAAAIAGVLVLGGLTSLFMVTLDGWARLAFGTVGVGMIAFTVFPSLERWARHRHRSTALMLRDQFWRAIGMLAVCLVGFGIPAATVLLQAETRLHEIFTLSMRSMALLLLFALFIGAAATLPALLFFLFAEQRRNVVKEQFHRDVLRLDPALRTIDEAERAYSPLMKDALDTRRGPLFFVPIILSTFLLSVGWVISALPTVASVAETLGDKPVELHSLFIPNRTAFTFAFLGTYFFALNMVFRRYVRADLGPKAYSHISVRIIIATILAWVMSKTFEGASPSGGAAPIDNAPWQLLVLAFFIGIVPDTGLAVLHDLLKTRMVTFFVPTLKDRDPLTHLEGITLYDKARLLEEGIENIENLAHHNLIELILRTRIPAPRLVDLVDQAILYLHARDEAEPARNAPSSILSRLKAHGIRTATDLELCMATQETRDAVIRLSSESRILLLLSALRDDEWMPQLRSWREFRKTYEYAYTVEQLTPLSPETRPRAA
ncbi:hypothetical protein WME73_15485 [Sorangium sp. So ce302]|uniref:hypothetical protein n=1 Tax=Sorangium sp. So ce302 TaxID=3133297 RepID=UPI003F615162